MRAAGLVLFDPAGTAHSRNVLQGLTDAAVDLPLTIVSREPPVAAADRSVTWRECSTPGQLVRTADRRRYRRALVDALAARPEGAVFCDLGLGRTVSSRGPRIRLGGPTVFIGHQSNAIDEHERLGRAERSANRRVLRDLCRQDARFVVHTARMRDRLLEYTAADRIVVSGWPVVAAADPCLGAGWDPRPEGVSLLFAGSVRREKGLLELVEALAHVDGYDRLVVPGRLGAGVRRDLGATTDPRIVLEDAFLDAAEYRARFAECALAVLPYTRRYVDHGIFSSVLAETMAYGRPMVVSEHLTELLPPGYRGAVVAAPGAAGLAAAIDDAIAQLPALTEAAMTVGRAFAAERFTYERYLAAILRAAS